MTQETHYADDEISLVDLVKILIKRWKVMLLVFLVIVFGALAYVLTITPTYDFVSMYQVAEHSSQREDDSRGLEPPATVVAKVNNIYMGPVVSELIASAEIDRLPFEVSVSNPSDTLLVKLTSEAAEVNSGLVEEMHERLLARIQDDQEALLERRRTTLENQLSDARNALDIAQESSSNAAADLVAGYIDRIGQIENSIAMLQEGQVVRVAVQSLEPKGTNKLLIMLLSLVLGGMLAVMAAFLVHFASLVRRSLKEEGGVP